MSPNTPDGRIRRRRRLGVATLLGYPLMAGCIVFVHFGWAWAVTAAVPGYLPFMAVGYSKIRHRPRPSRISRTALPGYFAAFTVYMASLLFPLVAMYSGRSVPGWLAAAIAGTAAAALIGLIWPMQLRYYRAVGLRPGPDAPPRLPEADFVRLTLRRASVAMGDDADAPHEESRRVLADSSLADVLSQVLGEGYLAKIHGGKATWVLESAGLPLAVVAQQWSRPRFLADPDQRIVTLVDQSGAVHLFFRYRMQQDPDAVFASLLPANPPDCPHETSPS